MFQLVKPELVEIKVSGAQAANREQRRLFDFSVRLNVKRPQDKTTAVVSPLPGTPASSPAAPVAAKKA